MLRRWPGDRLCANLSAVHEWFSRRAIIDELKSAGGGLARACSARDGSVWRRLEAFNPQPGRSSFPRRQLFSGVKPSPIHRISTRGGECLRFRAKDIGGRSLERCCGASGRSQLRYATSIPHGVSVSTELVAERTLRSPLLSSFRSVLWDYLRLSKYRLTGMVVLSAQAGYLLHPNEQETEDQRPTRSRSIEGLLSFGLNPWLAAIREQWNRVESFVWLSCGTFLCAASANAMNQIIESRLDARMRRTCIRPLPAGRLSVGHALAFACLCGITGVVFLYSGTTPTTALLGLGNTLLYVSVYTPLKVLTPVNTWVGALVGAVPPLMGWYAASPFRGPVRDAHLDGANTSGLPLTGLPLAALLFFWQIPHFHALALLCRTDYAVAGYRMLAQTNPLWNARLAWLSSIALIPTGMWFVSEGICASWFGFENALLALWMALKAGQLVRRPLDTAVARQLFRQSIFYLPLTLALMLLHRLPAEHAPAPVPGQQTAEASYSASAGPMRAETATALPMFELGFAPGSVSSESKKESHRLSWWHEHHHGWRNHPHPEVFYEFIPPLPYLPPPRP
ncbi:Protoheme IX farnesyltransferase, mitochondrial [Cyanidiococcus yangmingshanensis]|uniref:Protoheme IX farnesyltransferase, mitochondrial n=1 Tax=Cyanidiococcus yangmingshanensis TaxID=2690220 RepID=A0A7J7IR68_9RHOD|nr:Protoheme IX farnesyltransferase, mitochondrial [Cyanidiococcus yangmingshanensis]